MTDSEHEREFKAMLRSMDGTVVRVCLLFSERRTDGFVDLYQEIVGELWRGYLDFRRESSLSTWVYRVALNTAVSRRRRWRKQPALVLLDPALLAGIADTECDEQVERLYELIGRLPAAEQKLLFLYIDRMPLRDIAEVLGLNENSVKQRLKRLKHKLKWMHEHEE